MGFPEPFLRVAAVSWLSRTAKVQRTPSQQKQSYGEAHTDQSDRDQDEPQPPHSVSHRRLIVVRGVAWVAKHRRCRLSGPHASTIGAQGRDDQWDGCGWPETVASDVMA